MQRNPNLYSGVKTRKSAPLIPYPLSTTPNAPQLPVHNQHVPHLRRDQPMPPTIGFRWDIINGPNTTPPYPVMDNVGMRTNTADYSFKPVNEGSAEIRNSYKPDNTSSNINDIDSSVSHTTPSSPNVKLAADSQDRDIFTCEQIKVNEARPQPPLRGNKMHFARRGHPYPVEAYAKMKVLPCDHLGGDDCTKH
ncbi:unnamed protein product [Rodentolepis nana]|uniref:Ovule protein n=1 Tax=Rodentolepis nana TaxID=102285 RepID=A0A0R3TS77_RODNA|nr:unnamed protein product [Rodentolepis nana]